jgi:hypothetical protein
VLPGSFHKGLSVTSPALASDGTSPHKSVKFGNAGAEGGEVVNGSKGGEVKDPGEVKKQLLEKMREIEEKKGEVRRMEEAAKEAQAAASAGKKEVTPST